MTLVLSKKQWGSTEMHTTIAASVKIEKPWDLGLRGTGGQQLNCNQNLKNFHFQMIDFLLFSQEHVVQGTVV